MVYTIQLQSHLTGLTTMLKTYWRKSYSKFHGQSLLDLTFLRQTHSIVQINNTVTDMNVDILEIIPSGNGNSLLLNSNTATIMLIELVDLHNTQHNLHIQQCDWIEKPNTKNKGQL